MTNKQRLAHPCPECHAKAGSPCVYPWGDPTPRPHKTRGPGQHDKHIAQGIERRRQRQLASYGPLFQEVAEEEVPRETVAGVKVAERFAHARAAEQSSVFDTAMNGLEWIRLQHIRRELASIIGEFWAEALWGYAVRLFRSSESNINNFLANACTTTTEVRVLVELRNDPTRKRTTHITNIRGEQIPLNVSGDYLHDLLVWPPYAIPLPVMTRAEWDARFPRVERERGPGRDQEHDDGGLFERTVARVR